MRTDDEIVDEQEIDDDETSLADDVLDEVADDADPEDLETEGFGLLPDTDDDDDDKPEDEELHEEESLEEDAEDVDYDTFDDIDEM